MSAHFPKTFHTIADAGTIILGELVGCSRNSVARATEIADFVRRAGLTFRVAMPREAKLATGSARKRSCGLHI